MISIALGIIGTVICIYGIIIISGLVGFAVVLALPDLYAPAPAPAEPKEKVWRSNWSVMMGRDK